MQRCQSPFFFAVLLAAALHAGWNTLVKGSSDKWVSVTAVVIGHVLLSVLVLLIFPFPAVDSVPYAVVSGLIHTGYMLFLIFSYSVGDLSHVYPIARGMGPVLVTVVSILFLGVALTTGQIAAIVVVITGITILIFAQPFTMASSKSSVLAICTGCFIAGYSIADGLGARLAGSTATSSLAFFSLVCVLGSLSFLPVLVAKQPGALKEALRDWKLIVIAGGGSFAAYAIVVWGFTQAPLPLVTALRETSIIFALMLGVFVLKEPLNALKIIATLITVVGAVLVKIA